MGSGRCCHRLSVGQTRPVWTGYWPAGRTARSIWNFVLLWARGRDLVTRFEPGVGAKELKGFLDNCFEHFLLLFFCLRIMFPQLFACFKFCFYSLAVEMLFFLTSMPINNQSRQHGDSYLTMCTKLACPNWASRLRRCLVLEVMSSYLFT
jgi:hypothetical protein